MEIIQYWARVPTPHTDPLWHRATALWAGITAHLPDLAPAVALQQRLVRLTLDATSALADTPLLALEPASILGKWQKGLPLLRNEVNPIPPGLKTSFSRSALLWPTRGPATAHSTSERQSPLNL